MNKELLDLINKASRNLSEEIRMDRAIEEIIYQKMRRYEIPFLLIKEFGKNNRIQEIPMVSKRIIYFPAGKLGKNEKAGIMYGSSLIHIDSGRLRIAPKELQSQLIQINDQMYQLRKKKQELLEQYWPKAKKLTWQKAEDYDKVKKQFWKTKV